MTATTPATYLADQIADEMTIARLLGYRKLEPVIPTVGNPNTIWGVAPDFKPEWEGATGRGMLPQWRRSWAGAGELIARYNINVAQRGAEVPELGGVTIEAHCRISESDLSYFEFVADHQTKEAAIWAAVCKAAIAYLSAKAESKA